MTVRAFLNVSDRLKKLAEAIGGMPVRNLQMNLWLNAAASAAAVHQRLHLGLGWILAGNMKGPAQLLP